MQSSLSVLKYATPYIRLYKKKAFVIKIGGGLLDDEEALNGLCEQIVLLGHLGIRVVVVHGGGQQATAMQQRLGVKSEFVGGRRITDKDTLEITRMVYRGTLNLQLVEALQRFGAPAVGLSGVDGEMVTVDRRPPVMMKRDDSEKEELVDFGYVGDIREVRPHLLNYLIEGGFIPVLCCLAADTKGQVLNVNADVLASNLAVAMGAEKLFFISDVPGILRDANEPLSLVPYIDRKGIEELKEQGVLTKGILPKVDSSLHALENGVNRVHMISGKSEDSLLKEVFTNEGAGTLVVLDEEKQPEVPFNTD